MAFDNPPFIMDGTTLDGEVIRRAIGTLISPAGGIVTPGDLAVTQQTVPNMSVQIAPGQLWMPGQSTATQGPYYTRNGAAVTVPISASDPTNPRIDQIIVQVEDAAYAGASKLLQPAVIIGTPTSGAVYPSNVVGLGAFPPANSSAYLLADVNVPANATSITTGNIFNVAAVATSSPSRGATNITASQSTSSTTYTTLSTPDQISNIVLPTNGLIAVWYQATWQCSVSGGEPRAAIFLNNNQLKIAGQPAAAPATQAATVNGPATTNFSLSSSSIGLVGTSSSQGGADVTTGQVVGLTVAGDIYYDIGGSVIFETTMPAGGPCYIFAAAGTYTVSVQFKAPSGSVTASNRKLWVQAIPFS